ncbi:hypothetical protein Aple_060290 [Acrocarpospora pleiomorpha]|uniref:Carrier domain-containing protein n=1 Tax=Acrocarpospora pleiomorpha TaxID=90975 RepID=A0A5M3XQK9_9ACTN|nr:acyl carrier protein [Acrocarpospora pleiomorpha]GES23130.1 hypothetical protein Aple_060290 [Acrocarpospora pleiomorpha]
MDQRTIEDLIIELVARDIRTDPESLRDRLEQTGDELPIDSLLAAEVVARLEAQCGVKLPTTAETARALRSVRDFAAIVLDLITAAARDQRVREGA